MEEYWNRLCGIVRDTRERREMAGLETTDVHQLIPFHYPMNPKDTATNIIQGQPLVADGIPFRRHGP